MKMFVLKYTEYAWEEGDTESFYIIGIYSSKKLAQKAKQELFIKRAGEVEKGRFGAEFINGKFYKLHGDTDIIELELDKTNLHGWW